MESRVFISRAKGDSQVAAALCAELESRGIRCWIAPRDIVVGTDFAASIERAIAECAAFVLLYSRSAVESVHVRNELQRAVHHRKAVLPLVADDSTIEGGFAYFVGASHWIEVRDGRLGEAAVSVADALRALRADGDVASLEAPRRSDDESGPLDRTRDAQPSGAAAEDALRGATGAESTPGSPPDRRTAAGGKLGSFRALAVGAALVVLAAGSVFLWAHGCEGERDAEARRTLALRSASTRLGALVDLARRVRTAARGVSPADESTSAADGAAALLDACRRVGAVAADGRTRAPSWDSTSISGAESLGIDGAALLRLEVDFEIVLAVSQRVATAAELVAVGRSGTLAAEEAAERLRIERSALEARCSLLELAIQTMVPDRELAFYATDAADDVGHEREASVTADGARQALSTLSVDRSTWGRQASAAAATPEIAGVLRQLDPIEVESSARRAAWSLHRLLLRRSGVRAPRAALVLAGADPPAGSVVRTGDVIVEVDERPLRPDDDVRRLVGARGARISIRRVVASSVESVVADAREIPSGARWALLPLED